MLNSEDITRLRSETDGTGKVIHLNNAGSSLPPNRVRDTMMDYLQEEMTFGGYETHTKRFDEIEGVYDSVAKLIGANRDEIAMLENATVAWNAAFQAIDWKDGDIIIATSADYASNYLSYLHLQKKVAIKIKVIPNDKYDQPDLEALKALMTDKVKLVSVTHMPTNSGLLVDAEGIGAIVRNHHAFYLLDACQTVGQYPIDVERIGCDMLSATGRKYLRGPRGTGFLYASRHVLAQLTPYWIDLHSAQWTAEDEYVIRKDARKFENWEGSRANTLGLKVAVDYILEIGIEKIWQRVQALGEYTRQQLAGIPSVTVRDIGETKGAIVSFTVEGMSADEVKSSLLERGVNISWNGISNTYLDMDARGLSEILRASPHYYNTKEEIDQFCKELENVI